MLLWRVGGSAFTAKKGGNDVEDVNLARGPEGRLWIMWADSGQLYAARTNRAANRAGAIVAVRPPPGTSSVWDVFGEGSLGHLDLLTHVSVGSAIATWHKQVLPGLSLSCAARGKAARCSVADAGDPVRGATVKIGGKTASTKANGSVSVVLKPGSYNVQARKSGYTSTSAKLRIR